MNVFSMMSAVICVCGCSGSQPLRYMPVETRESSERAFAYGLWIAIGEVYCDCGSDGLAIENLQRVPLVEDLLQESVTDDRTIGVLASRGWPWT
jgi:hypothetical protein